MARTAEEKTELKAQRLGRLEEYRVKGFFADCGGCMLDEAAQILGCSKQAVYKQIDKRAISKTDDLCLVDLASLEAYIKGEGKSERLKENKQKRLEADKIIFDSANGQLFWDYDFYSKTLERKTDKKISVYLCELSELVEKITRNAVQHFVYHIYKSRNVWAECFPLYDDDDIVRRKIIGAMVSVRAGVFTQHGNFFTQLIKYERKPKRDKRKDRQHNADGTF